MDHKKGPKYFVTKFNASYISRCDKCHKKSWRSFTRPCIICGIQLCKNCYHAGFCKDHWFELEGPDRDRVEQLARQGQLSWCLFIVGYVVMVIISVNIFNSAPTIQLPWVIIIALGGGAVSLLVPILYDRILRASFWKVVGKYHFTTQEDSENEKEVLEKEEIKGMQKGEEEVINPPEDSKVILCAHCGWILISIDSKCPRCGFVI